MNPIFSKAGLFKFSFFTLLLLLSVYSTYSMYSATRQMYWDFPNYYVSARLVSEGEQLTQFYDNNWFEEKGHEMGIQPNVRFNPFPPITALVMLPLSGMPPMLAKQIWVVLNGLILLATIALWRKVFHMDWISSAFIILLTGMALALNFRLGQIYLIILFSLLAVYYLYHQKKWNMAASILSVITILKYFPVVFIVGFFKKSLLLRFSLACIFLVALQWVLFGTAAMENYIHVLLNHLNGNIDGQGQHLVQFQSFDSLFSNIFIENLDTGKLPLINWPLGKNIFKWLIISIIVGSILYLIQKIRQSKLDNKPNYLLAITGIGFYTILPASASYHLILLLFPLGVLLRLEYGRAPFAQCFTLLLLFTFACNSGILGIITNRYEGFAIFLNYPRLWAVLLLYALSYYMIYKRTKADPYNSPESKGLIRLWQ